MADNSSDPTLHARLEEERRLRISQVAAVRFEPLPTPFEGAWPLVPGSLLVIWALSSVELNPIVDQFRARDPSVASLLNAELEIDSTGQVRGDPLDRMRAFAEIRYRGRSLIGTAVLPPEASAPVDYTVLPWVGGSLDGKDFSSTSWLLAGAEPMAFAVIANPPAVDETEARILSALPAEVAELGMMPTTTPVVATVEGAGAAATWVARQVGKAVVGKVVDVVAQKAVDRYNNWADRHERQVQVDRRAAEQRLQERAFAERTRYRNASRVATPLQSNGFTPEETSLDDLLSRRVRALLERADVEAEKRDG